MRVRTRTSDAETGAEARHRAELDAQREEFHRELSRRNFRIGELEEQVIEVAQTYETSLSWRLTRPVRSAKTALAKLRRD